MKAVVAAFNQEKALVTSRGLLRDCTTGYGTDGALHSTIEGGQHDEHGGHQVWGGDVSRARDGDQDDACPRPGAAREGDQWSAV